MIAIFGGAFNPITLAHLSVAKSVLHYVPVVSSVWMMPCFGHSFEKTMADPYHRLKMCELAVEGHKNIKISSFEIDERLDGETWKTINLMKQKRILGTNEDFFIIIGQDNANCINEWHNASLLKNEMRWIITRRAGFIPDRNPWYERPCNYVIETQESTYAAVSSTKVRRAIAERKLDIAKEMVHPLVFEYMIKNLLYV